MVKEKAPSTSAASSSVSSSQERQEQTSEPNRPQTDDGDDVSTSCLGKAAYQWSEVTHSIHRLLLRACLFLSLRAARMPKRCLGLVGLISVAMLAAGFFTNFDMRVNDEDIFAPTGSLPIKHFEWIFGPDTVFKSVFRPVLFMVHTDGNNVLHHDGIQRLFEVIDAIQELPDDAYSSTCKTGGFVNHEGVRACRMLTATRFWNDNVTLFQEETQGSDEITVETLSKSHFDEQGTPVFHEMLLGNLQWDNETSPTRQLTFAQALTVAIQLPATKEAELLEKMIETRLLPMREEWTDQGPDVNPFGFRLEFYSARALSDELTRAINDDLPLLALVFILMSGFTCFVFFRKDPVQSRCLLGIGSVVTILMSIMTGYGLSFLLGIPFTSLTQILPFVIFGVGLDDTFILTGAYFRTDPSKNPVDRIKDTMEEVSASVCMTTITTTAAFALGCISSVPAIRWLCLYAFLTIAIDFIYQITFFVSIMVLDQRRIEARRRDLCVCFSVAEDEHEDTTSRASNKSPDAQHMSRSENCIEEVLTPDAGDKGAMSALTKSTEVEEPMPDRIMAWYAERLLHPVVKISVVIVFFALFGVCGWSATQIEQSFKASDFLPTDSYVLGFVELADTFTTESLRFPIYFRNVNQSDPEIQQQMIRYVNDLVALPQIHRAPLVCWVRDFQEFRNGDSEFAQEYSWVFSGDFSFDQQLDLALSLPEVNEIYGYDIARDEDGSIIASRCWLTVHGVDLDSVEDQMGFLADQRNVTFSQEINKSYHEDGSELSFFTFDTLYFLWEFFTVAVGELIFTTVSGVVAVSVVGFLLIPHWTAILFVAPLILVLYIDLIGVLRFAGLRINPLTYVCLVMSVGLLVDFLMHIILRYYESGKKTREDKVKDTLRTMGSSILVGGLSTCFGVIPLAFSSSAILRTVSTAFISMVTIGVGHGLILLPVLLSYLGPTSTIRIKRHLKNEPKQTEQTLDAAHTDAANGDEEDASSPTSPPTSVQVSRKWDRFRAGDAYGSNSSLASSDGTPVLRNDGGEMILAFLEDVRMADDTNSPPDGSLVLPNPNNGNTSSNSSASEVIEEVEV